MKHGIALLLALEVLCSSGAASAKGPIREVEVARTRVQLADVVPQIAPDAAAVDIGPAPAPGGARLYTREDLRKAIESARTQVPSSLPVAVRVTRKMARLSIADIERIARAELANNRALPRGATLGKVLPAAPIDLPAGWDAVRATLPQRPHRVGVSRTTAVLTFTAGPDTLGAVTVPIELDLNAEAAAFDLQKGGAIKVVVRRGSIEIEAQAISAADADVGAVIPVMLRGSGRVVRAKLLDREHAELVEGG